MELLVDGDQVILDNQYAEVVGVRANGYDIVRHSDNRVIREVPRELLCPVV